MAKRDSDFYPANNRDENGSDGQSVHLSNLLVESIVFQRPLNRLPCTLLWEHNKVVSSHTISLLLHKYLV